MDRITADIRGSGQLSAGQELRLSTVRTLLISLISIGKYVDKQPNMIQDGDLLPILRNSFVKFSTALRSELDGLYATIKAKEEIPDLEGYLTSAYGKGKK